MRSSAPNANSQRLGLPTVGPIIPRSYPGASSSEPRWRALAPHPAILVADEPTGNLDEETGRHIIDLLFAGHIEHGTTLVLVTHDPLLARRCDRVVRLRSGRIEEALTPP